MARSEALNSHVKALCARVADFEKADATLMDVGGPAINWIDRYEKHIGAARDTGDAVEVNALRYMARSLEEVRGTPPAEIAESTSGTSSQPHD